MNFESLLAKVEKLSAQLFSNININSHNNTVNNTIIITADALKEARQDPEKAKKLAQLSEEVRTYIDAGGKYFLPSIKSTEDIKQIKHLHEDAQYSELLNFIKLAIPSKDRSIWMAALVLRDEFKKGNQDRVRVIKEDMLRLHGTRAANITNLCTAGYLESEIIPLYEVQSEELDKFNENYENIVMEYPFAVFVRSENSDKEVILQIKNKINQLLENHQPRVDIHGLGYKNVETINKAIRIITKEYAENIIDVQITSSQKFIKVQIFLMTA